MSETKKSNALEEANLHQQVHTIQAEVEGLLKQKDEMMLQIELEKRNLEKASKEMDDYHYYCKVREDYKREKALRSERKKELQTRQIESMRKLKQIQEEEQSSVLRKQQAQDAMRLAEAKKQANSETETNIILPGKIELTKLAERKMKLAAKIAEASKNAQKEKAKEQEALNSRNQAKKDAIAQTETLETQYKAKQEEKEATCKTHQEFIQSHNDQIASHEAQAKKLTELQKAEHEAYEKRLLEGKERWSEKLLCHVTEQEQIFEAHAFKYDVYKRGIIMLQEAQEVERKARAK